MTVAWNIYIAIQWHSQDFEEGGAKRGRERVRSACENFYQKPHALIMT